MKKRNARIQDPGFGREEIELVMAINGVDRTEAIRILEQRHVLHQTGGQKNDSCSSFGRYGADDEQFISAEEFFGGRD